MAITITVAEVTRAVRAGSGDATTAEITRLLEYATIVIDDYVDDAPDVVANQAAVMLVGYIFDRPTTYRYASYANLIRNSGVGSVLLPYRVIRGGNVAQGAIDTAQAAVGSVGNPVVDVRFASDTLTVEFADGNSSTYTIMASDLDARVQALIDAHAALPEIHHAPGMGGTTNLGILDIVDGRLPAPPVALRTAWQPALDTPVNAATFSVDDGYTTNGGAVQPYPPAWLDAGNNTAAFLMWIASTVTPTVLYPRSFSFTEGVALTVDGVDGQYFMRTELLTYRYRNGSPFGALLPGERVATRTWVTARIADIMLSGGGITAAQAQTLIDAAVVGYQTDAEVTAIVTAALAALPSYQTLAEVNALITAAINAIVPGQTATQVAALIALHAAMPNAHHTPGGGGGAGFPSTRTQVFSTRAVGGSGAVTHQATEAWLPDQLYELVLGGRTRHIILSDPSGSTGWIYDTPDILSDNNRKSAYVFIIPTIGQTTTTTNIQREGAGAGINVEVNKLT